MVESFRERLDMGLRTTILLPSQIHGIDRFNGLEFAYLGQFGLWPKFVRLKIGKQKLEKELL